MSRLNLSHATYVQHRQKDMVGEVFEFDGQVLRGIFQDHSDDMRALLSSGLIDDLVNEGLFPKTEVSDFTHPKYAFILKHDKIWPVTLPHEWSFLMYKSASLCVLRVAEIARSYGYNMKDCHALNVLFSDSTPLFVDLGSFVKNQKGVVGWRCHEEFLRSYVYPLVIWSTGLNVTSKSSLAFGNLITHEEYRLFELKMLRILPLPVLRFFAILPLVLTKIANMPAERINQIRLPSVFKICLKLVKKIKARHFNKASDLNHLRKRVLALNLRYKKSLWFDYHSRISQKAKRFDRIVDLINDNISGAKSAVDIAGNQGRFSEILLEKTSVSKVICQDFDEAAIDAGFFRITKESDKKNVDFINYNFMSPLSKKGIKPINERLQCDITICLALLHHLILSQKYDLETIIQELYDYGSEYLVVEFMPKGLWLYGGETNVPSWYTSSWFKDKMTARYSIIAEEQIEENYILFIGKRKIV